MEQATVDPARHTTMRLAMYFHAFGVMVFAVMSTVGLLLLVARPQDWPRNLLLTAFFLGMEALAIYQLRRARRGLAAVTVR